jgi:hypothetical protein
MVEQTGHCPYLGLKQNQAIRFASPTPEHRCYAAGQAQEIPGYEPNYQSVYCLSANHVKCPLYTGRGLPSTPTPPVTAPRLEPALAQAGGLRGWLSGLPLRDRAIYALLLSLLALIFVIYAVAGVGLLSTGSIFGNGTPPIASPEPTSDGGLLPGGTPSPTPSPTPEPVTATTEPTDEPATATSRPTATPRPSPRPTRTISPTPRATSTETALPTIEAITWTPSATPPPLPPTRVPPTWTPSPTNTPTDLTPLPPDTPTVEPSSTTEPTAEAPTAEPPTAEPPTAEPPTEGPTPDPARTETVVLSTPQFRR